MRVKLSENLKIKDLVKRLMSSYRQREVIIEQTDTVTVNACDIQWSGGSKSTYSLGTRILNSGEHKIPVGQFVVESGIFCGKKSTLRIYGDFTNYV